MSRNTVSELVIKLIEQVSGPAKKAEQGLKGVSRAADALNSATAAKGAETLASSLKNIEKAAKSAGRGIQADWSRGFKDQIDKLALSSKKLDDVKRSWQDLLKSLQQSGKVKPNDFLPALDAWEKKTLAGLKRVQNEARRTTRETDRLRSGASFAAGALGVGGGAYAVNRAGRYATRAAAEYGREGARNYLAGMTPAESAEAKALAGVYSAKYPSLDQAQIQERIRNMRSFAGSMGEAKPLLDDHLKALVVLQSIKGKDRAMDEMQAYMKGLDVLGKNDEPGSIKGLTNAYIKALGVDSDLDMGSFASFARRSKSAGAALSNDFLGAVVPTFLQDMGGPQLGTALGTEVSAMIAGRATKESKAYQQQVGIRDKKGKVVGEQLLATNPYEWARKYVPDAMKRAKLDVNNETDVLKFMSKNFSDQTVANLFTKFITQAGQVERNKALYGAAPGLEAADKLPAKDPFVAWESFLSQLRNVAATAADPLIPTAAAALNTLAGALSNLAKAAAENPVAAGAATGALGAGALGVAGLTGYHGMKTGWRWLTGGGGAAAAGGGATGGGILSRIAAAARGAVLSPLGLAISATAAAGAHLYNQRTAPGYRPISGDEKPLNIGGWLGSKLHGTPAPGLDEVKGKAEEASRALGEVGNQRVAPTVETSGIDAALAKVRELLGMLQTLGRTNVSPSVTPKIAPAPSAGPTSGRAPAPPAHIERQVFHDGYSDFYQREG